MTIHYFLPNKKPAPVTVRVMFHSDSPPGGGDHTNFVDVIELLDNNGTVMPGVIGDPSFEIHRVHGSYEYRVADPNTPWVFDNHSGIAANGSAFGVVDAPDGQTGLIQGEDLIGLYQDISLLPGTYYLRFLAENREANRQLLGLYVNGAHLLTVDPPVQRFQQYTSPAFSV